MDEKRIAGEKRKDNADVQGGGQKQIPRFAGDFESHVRNEVCERARGFVKLGDLWHR